MEINTQVKNSFDYQTIQKIGRGMLIAGTGAAALFGINAIANLQIDNVVLAGFITWAVPVAFNTVREWMKGEGVDTE